MSRLLNCVLLFVFTLVRAQYAGQEVNLNGVVDLLLSGVEEELGRGSGELGKLPDMNKSWSRLGVRVSLTCSGGKISSLGNISRDGDVVLRKDGGQVSLRAALTLHLLKIHYANCVVKGAGLKSSDPLLLSADSVSLIVKISASRTPDNCTNELDYMVVTSLGEVTVEMGAGVVAWLKEALVNYLARTNKNSALEGLNKKLEDAATKALVKRKNICSKIFFYVRN